MPLSLLRHGRPVLQEDSSPKVLSETLKRIKTGRPSIHHSGVRTLFPSYKDRVTCRVVIRSEYGADMKGGVPKDLEATVVFVTLCCSEIKIFIGPSKQVVERK